MRALLLSIMLIPFWARAQAPPSPDADRYRVVVPRYDEPVVIDGDLSDEVWSRAAGLGGFRLFTPVDDRPALDSTRVLVWYSGDGLYVGVRAYETHGEVRATLADRDRIDADDLLMLVLDTYADQRQAFAFLVNPLGVQGDGTLRDIQRATGVIARDSDDLPYLLDPTSDFDFESAGRLVPEGYDVEIFLPFRSLRFQDAGEQEWGFNVIRHVRHSGYGQSWAPLSRQDASFLSQSGRLAGLRGMNRGTVLELVPEVTAGTIREGTGAMDFRNPEAGGTVRWGVTNSLSLAATANPDFSHVEADVVQVEFDPRRSPYYPEKRLFFLDGIEFFETPLRLIYTRQLVQPTVALKAAGKVSGIGIGLLSGVDRQSVSDSGRDVPYHNALRLSKDLWGQSTVGVTYTDRQEGTGSNRVAALDGRFVLRDRISIVGQAAGSWTREGPTTIFAPSWTLTLTRSGRRFGLVSRFRGVHPDFRAETGFVSRRDVASFSLSPQLTFYGPRGAFLETLTASVNANGTWSYEAFSDRQKPDDRQLFLNGRFGLRGGWILGTSVLVEAFGYPGKMFEDYAIQRLDASGVPVDTVAFVGTPELHDLSYAVNVLTPRFETFSGGAYIFYGRDVNWWEWAGTDLFIVEAELHWTPSDRFRVELLYDHFQYIRPGDRSNVEIRRIPRLKVEYQVTRAFFVRVVGQYEARAVDTLRDESRTGFPILLRNEDGSWGPARGWRKNDLRVDILLSYRPTPGTVVFLGYGSGFEEPESFRFRRVERTSDGFFLKLSYLIRT